MKSWKQLHAATCLLGKLSQQLVMLTMRNNCRFCKVTRRLRRLDLQSSTQQPLLACVQSLQALRADRVDRVAIHQSCVARVAAKIACMKVADETSKIGPHIAANTNEFVSKAGS